MMTNVMVKKCLNQKVIKNSNLIQAMKNSVCPTANVTRRPIFSENRIFLSLRIGDSTHDMTIVRWHLLNFCKAFGKPNLSEYLPNVPNSEFSEFRIPNSEFRIPKCGLNTRHDMIIVKWHLFIWHERKLCALTNAPPVQCTQMGQWLSTLFHANCSAAQLYVLHPGQFIFALSWRRRSFLPVLQSTER